MSWLKPALMLGSAAIGPLSSLLGGKSAEQKAQEEAVAKSQQRGTTTFGQSQRALTPALNFNEKLLSGDPATAMSAIGPEANTILSQYDTARRAVAQNAPRGGGATRKMANLPFEASGKITNLLNVSRRGAAGELSKLFSTLTSSAADYSQQGISGTANLARTALERRKQQFDEGAALGKSFGSVFSKFLNPSSDSGGGGGGTSTSFDPNAYPIPGVYKDIYGADQLGAG